MTVWIVNRLNIYCADKAIKIKKKKKAKSIQPVGSAKHAKMCPFSAYHVQLAKSKRGKEKKMWAERYDNKNNWKRKSETGN